MVEDKEEGKEEVEYLLIYTTLSTLTTWNTWLESYESHNFQETK